MKIEKQNVHFEKFKEEIIRRDYSNMKAERHLFIFITLSYHSIYRSFPSIFFNTNVLNSLELFTSLSSPKYRNIKDQHAQKIIDI